MTSTTALILAGGMGTRLRPLTGNLPKALAPVAGRPFLHYILQYLQSQEIVDIVLCTGYQSESVASYFEERPSLGHVRCSPEAKPLGTAGAVKQAECLIASDPFLVLNGDSLLPADLTQLVSFHKEKQAAITIVLTEVPDKTRFGSVLLTTDGSIVAFSEKGNQGPGLINAGIYLIDRAVLETIPSECEVSIERDVFPSFVGNGICGMVVPGTFVDIGTPEAYAMAQTAFPYQPEIGQR